MSPVFKWLLALALFIFCANAASATITINVTSPTVTTVAAGSSFTITATASTTYFLGLFDVEIDPYNYNGFNALNVVYNPSNPYTISATTTAPTTPGTYVYQVYVSDYSGASKTVNVTITVALPAPTVTASSTSVCGSTAVTLTASDAAGTGGTYTWYNVASGGTALQSSTSTTYTPTVTATTTYYVSYTYGGTTSSLGSVTVTVNAAPTAGTFTSPSVVNINTAATITLTSTVVAGYTYSWNFGGGTSSSTTGTGPFSVTWSTYGTKTITLTISNASGCTAVTTQTVTVALPVTSTNYAFSQPITLNTSSFGISSTLTNFPYLVYIQENALKSGVNCANNVQYPSGGTNGYDFAFTLNGSSTELFYQVESFNSSTGTLLVWVEIPSVTSTNASLTFYFGASSPLHTTAFTQNTWDTEYLGVYHFDEGSTSSTILDATSNGNTGTQSNTGVVTGKIGNGYSFNGTNTYITTASSSSLNITGSFTLSAWVYTNSPYTASTAGAGSGAYDYKIMTNEASYTNGGYKMGLYGSSATTVYPEVETRNGGTAYLDRSTSTSQTFVTTGTWHYIQGIYNSSNSTFYSYIDGVLSNSSTSATASSSNVAPLYFGSDFGTGNFINGGMDECRVSNDAKSSDWIKAEYKNQSSPSTYTTTGSTITSTFANSSAIGGSIVYTWTGTTSTDPTVATNWKSSASGTPNAVPAFDGSASLDIPVVTTYPKLTASESVYGLTIESGAQLNLNGFTLSVGCHIYNNSTTGGNILYGSSTGGITWNGSLATQYYYGSSASFMSVGNMTVNNSAGGTVQITGGAVAMYNTLTLTKGNLYVNNSGSGSLTLMSTSTGSAAVAAIPSTYSITGTVNVQRYLTGNTSSSYRSYRLLSSPVNATSATSGTSNYINFGTLNSTYSVGGTSYYGAFTAGVGSGFSFSNRNPTIYLYDEVLNPSAASKNSSFTSGKYAGFTSISGTTVTLTNYALGTTTTQVPVGNGYILFYIGSTNGRSTTNPESTLPDNANMTSVGYLNQQSVAVNLWYTPTGGTAGKLSYTGTVLATNYPGYNMVGNPYASTIDLKQLYTDNYNSTSNAISGNFYELYDVNPSQNFTVYAASGGTSGANSSEYVVSGQGFFAIATATGQTLTFKEDQKVSALTTSPLDLNVLNPKMRTANVDLQADTLQGLHLKLIVDTAAYDECGIYFSKNCKDTFDDFDAADLDGINSKAFLSSYTIDNTRVALNKMGDYTHGGKRIKLYVSAKADGIYKLAMTDFQNIDTANYRVYLIDNALNDSLNMTAYKSYTFNFQVADTAAYHNRFVLAIEPINSARYQLTTFSGQKVAQGIQLSWKTTNEQDYVDFALQKLENGTYVTIDTLQSNGAGSYTYLDSKPSANTNTYRLLQNYNGEITYAGPIVINYSDQSANNGFSIYPNPSKSVIHVSVTTASTQSSTYVVKTYNVLGQLVDNRSVSQNTWSQDVSSYKDGVYVIELMNTNGDVVGKAKFIKVD